jgi:hypothetical protein
MQHNIGSQIRKHCYNNHIALSSLAAMINLSPSAFYRSLQRSNMSVNSLLAISKALNHNFFQYLWVDKTIPTKEEAIALRSEISQLKAEVSRLTNENALLHKLTSRT